MKAAEKCDKPPWIVTRSTKHADTILFKGLERAARRTYDAFREASLNRSRDFPPNADNRAYSLVRDDGETLCLCACCWTDYDCGVLVAKPFTSSGHASCDASNLKGLKKGRRLRGEPEAPSWNP